jgi:hypothetical protein
MKWFLFPDDYIILNKNKINYGMFQISLILIIDRMFTLFHSFLERLQD